MISSASNFVSTLCWLWYNKRLIFDIANNGWSEGIKFRFTALHFSRSLTFSFYLVSTVFIPFQHVPIIVISIIYLWFHIGPSSNTNARDSSQMGSIGLTSLDYSNHSSLDSMNSTSNVGTSNTTSNKRTRDLAVCAVVLDEWLKELAAISQEQSIVMLTEFINHFWLNRVDHKLTIRKNGKCWPKQQRCAAQKHWSNYD